MDNDFCSIISDMLLFFRIVFLAKEPEDRNRDSAGEAVGDGGETIKDDLRSPVDRGP